jgi:hypothetical protein
MKLPEHSLYKKITQTPVWKDLLVTFAVQVLIMGSVFAINKILSIRLGGVSRIYG